MSTRKDRTRSLWLLLAGARPIEITADVPFVARGDGVHEVARRPGAWSGVATHFAFSSDKTWRPIAELKSLAYGKVV